MPLGAMDKGCEIEFLEESLKKGNSLRFRALGDWYVSFVQGVSDMNSAN